MKALVSAFNQEKALAGSFSMVVKLKPQFSQRFVYSSTELRTINALLCYTHSTHCHWMWHFALSKVLVACIQILTLTVLIASIYKLILTSNKTLCFISQSLLNTHFNMSTQMRFSAFCMQKVYYLVASEISGLAWQSNNVDRDLIACCWSHGH